MPNIEYALNKQAKLMDEWRKSIVGLLLRPLVDNEEVASISSALPRSYADDGLESIRWYFQKVGAQRLRWIRLEKQEEGTISIRTASLVKAADGTEKWQDFILKPSFKPLTESQMAQLWSAVDASFNVRPGPAATWISYAKGPYLNNFQPWLDSHCRDILDDCDFTLAVKTQLNYPSGPEIAVDGNAYRWTVAQELLALVAYYVPTLQERLPSAVSLTPTTDYLPPHQGCAVVLPPSTQCYGRHLTQEALRSIFERLSTLRLRLLGSKRQNVHWMDQVARWRPMNLSPLPAPSDTSPPTLHSNSVSAQENTPAPGNGHGHAVQGPEVFPDENLPFPVHGEVHGDAQRAIAAYNASILNNDGQDGARADDLRVLPIIELSIVSAHFHPPSPAAATSTDRKCRVYSSTRNWRGEAEAPEPEDPDLMYPEDRMVADLRPDLSNVATSTSTSRGNIGPPVTIPRRSGLRLKTKDETKDKTKDK
ncbi:hypothetical protein F4821DRAFT_261955 [Hypoxylon rubiginosum]|uniref:Uncharacterized protein n=1 Tax=Hypoxylon rubiginosum TaxID=110542 RepID=A0ACC0CVF4_9PEZI|nr:hypothetical protein F4821DRAFT_261955 [Hypoxylon rubiginosum]